LVKGLVVGGLLGFALAKAGFIAPGAIMAYLAGAGAGALVGLVAGKPIWAKDAKIEAGMKAVVGALLGAGLMFVARKWLGFLMPVSLGSLADANASLGETNVMGSFGGLAVTSLAFVAAVLGGFYEVDNTPEDDAQKAEGGARVAEGKGNARIAASASDEDEEIDEAENTKQAKKR
jgi:hypothetical protein